MVDFLRAREGDLIKTKSGVIFDVKGVVHPPDKIIAFPRYIPSLEGKRREMGGSYVKVYNLNERFEYLKKAAPSLIVFDQVFGEALCEVPRKAVTKHYMPVQKLSELRKTEELSDLEQKAVLLAELLRKVAVIPWESIGVSGSIMAGLFTTQSDIDPIVYGAENCRRVYAALESMLEDESSLFKRYTQNELQVLFEFRSKDTLMSFEDFGNVEGRKAFQGKFEGVDFFVRFVKDWDEICEEYGDLCYNNVGYAKLTGVIADDSEALFTPCAYKLKNVKVLEGKRVDRICEVVSFRGRFCKQAKTGEKIVAQGKVEHVKDNRGDNEFHRLILGNMPQDYMALSHR